ncbi:MAG: hypothetical protein JSS66_00275 [Armatimonadetes bacterium]|nr:hypothetical protein [Armatimonadota bacterium]
MKPRTVLNGILPVALTLAAWSTGTAQEADEPWQRWYSETLRVSFEAKGKPVEELVELQGPLAEVVAKCEGVGFNVEGAELSLLHLTAKDGVTLTPADTFERRIRGIKSKAPDFAEDDRIEKLESDFPLVSALVTFADPDGAHSVRRVMVVGSGSEQWLLEARGMSNNTERLAAYRFLDSLRMDKEGKIKPGAPKKG